MKELLGRTIKSVYKMGDTTLVFKTDKGLISYDTHGDCCSSSWFSNITGIKNLLGQKVNEVVEREEFSDDEIKKAEAEYKKNNEYEAESLALYGYLLKTDKGTCDIEFRNESNGYYGGWCELSNVTKVTGLKPILNDY